MFGAQGQRAVSTDGVWCFRTLGLQGLLQGRLLSFGLVLLADFSPVPFLFSSSNSLPSLFRNQHPRLPRHPQRWLMLINVPLSTGHHCVSVFNMMATCFVYHGPGSVLSACVCHLVQFSQKPIYIRYEENEAQRQR